MKPPKLLTRMLATALIGVWGAVGYQVYTAAFATDSESGDAKAGAVPTRAQPYVYRADVDDPFEVHLPLKKKPKKPEVIIPWTPPEVKVTGILSGKGGMTAILEGPTGEISFLGEGDTTGGVKILKIRSGLVVYSYRNQRKEWTVDGRQ